MTGLPGTSSGGAGNVATSRTVSSCCCKAPVPATPSLAHSGQQRLGQCGHVNGLIRPRNVFLAAVKRGLTHAPSPHSWMQPRGQVLADRRRDSKRQSELEVWLCLSCGCRWLWFAEVCVRGWGAALRPLWPAGNRVVSTCQLLHVQPAAGQAEKEARRPHGQDPQLTLSFSSCNT